MIYVEEIQIKDIEEFWNLHYQYLIDEEMICDDEDKSYFKSAEYRDILKSHMERSTDKHHMVYFVCDGIRIGAAQYTTYQSEDGKCFILDFWVFPEYRGNKIGHNCFTCLEKYTKLDGAIYYELNSLKQNSIRFWKSLGFIEQGTDDYGMWLFIKR